MTGVFSAIESLLFRIISILYYSQVITGVQHTADHTPETDTNLHLKIVSLLYYYTDKDSKFIVLMRIEFFYSLVSERWTKTLIGKNLEITGSFLALWLAHRFTYLYYKSYSYVSRHDVMSTHTATENHNTSVFSSLLIFRSLKTLGLLCSAQAQ